MGKTNMTAELRPRIIAWHAEVSAPDANPATIMARVAASLRMELLGAAWADPGGAPSREAKAILAALDRENELYSLETPRRLLSALDAAEAAP